MLLFDGNKLNLFLPYAGWDVGSVLGAFALLRCSLVWGPDYEGQSYDGIRVGCRCTREIAT